MKLIKEFYSPLTRRLQAPVRSQIPIQRNPVQMERSRMRFMECCRYGF